MEGFNAELPVGNRLYARGLVFSRAKPTGRPGAIAAGNRGACRKIEFRFLRFGDYDVILIADYPDNVSAAAFSMAVTGGGAVKALRTRPLMTIDEGLQAMR